MDDSASKGFRSLLPDRPARAVLLNLVALVVYLVAAQLTFSAAVAGIVFVAVAVGLAVWTLPTRLGFITFAVVVLDSVNAAVLALSASWPDWLFGGALPHGLDGWAAIYSLVQLPLTVVLIFASILVLERRRRSSGSARARV